MSETETEADDARRYARPDTLEGMLQRGRGMGAILAARDPAGAAEPVRRCLRQDWRWDSVDERSVYLARLVRDLELPLEPVVELLAEDRESCERATGVLELLAVSGSAQAREALRDHVRTGPHWLDVLESVADRWPPAWWRDLAGVARARLDGDEQLSADEEARGTLDSLFSPDGPPPPHPSRRLSRVELTPPSPRLLALLADPGAPEGAKGPALRLLAGRAPEPDLLPLVPTLGSSYGSFPAPFLAAAVRRCGALALPAARTWVADDRSWLAWIGLEVLAEHGEDVDLPVLSAHLTDEYRRRGWCGPKMIAAGLARFGPAAAEAVPVLRRYYVHTPHSYERAAFLEALAAIDPEGLEAAYTEGLWDCEADVRLLAVAGAPDLPHVRDRLELLRDDPLETPEVRRAAAARLDRPGLPGTRREAAGA
ncbi:hypothetical protein ACIA8O_30840 [Kitasatospora sp. NPDC051853]|uniref:hypothetical protein n=1 Tax=Kitasatospora sp. NPDC051853 TaxID=3364058 RepID=UPI0037B75D7D